jgi:hypothetical protein
MLDLCKKAAGRPRQGSGLQVDGWKYHPPGDAPWAVLAELIARDLRKSWGMWTGQHGCLGARAGEAISWAAYTWPPKRCHSHRHPTLRYE